MNLTFILGIVAGFVLLVLAILQGGSWQLPVLFNFIDIPSVFIVFGGTIAAVVAGNPAKRLAAFPKHISIALNQKKFNPVMVIDDLVECAQIARKNGLLALEEKVNQVADPFFKKAIMLIVDGNDADKVRGILTSDMEELMTRHGDVVAMYERASSAAPAFGMIGTLIGLINMLNNMDMSAGGSSSIGSDMGTALITTLYGSVIANLIFNPISQSLAVRDEEECLCRELIIEGVAAIQSGENPKFIQERLMGFLEQGGPGKGAKQGGGGGEE